MAGNSSPFSWILTEKSVERLGGAGGLEAEVEVEAEAEASE